MANARKVIITCATTGAIHVPTMSPYLPLTPDQIVADALGAAEAGAAILHMHARDPEDGRPTPDPEVFLPILQRVKAQTDAVINVTTGGGHNMTVQERLITPLKAAPEMCSLNMGSMNFGLFPVLDKIETFNHEWEPQYLQNTRDFIFKNTFADIEYILKHLGEEHGTRFEFECYDIGHLHNLAFAVDKGWVKPPFFVQSIFGILGGIQPDIDHLVHMKRTADRLFGDAYVWSVLGAGRHQLNFATMGAIMGGNIRVGLEDSVYAGKGKLATSSAEQVRIMRSILENLSMEIATPAEARDILGLKGGNNVGF